MIKSVKKMIKIKTLKLNPKNFPNQLSVIPRRCHHHRRRHRRENEREHREIEDDGERDRERGLTGGRGFIQTNRIFFNPNLDLPCRGV